MHPSPASAPRTRRASPLRRTATAVVSTLAVVALLAGCASAGSTTATAARGQSTRRTGTSALDRWSRAYAYLSAQRQPTQIACVWLKTTNRAPSAVPRPARFYSFSTSNAWQHHIVTRWDAAPHGAYETCEATVPTTVPYGPEIETFLAARGLFFGSNPTPGLTRIEIAYAGQNASDPDIVYRDRPGLFGLRIALAPLGKRVFVTSSTNIIPPADDATAARYLRYATPLLNWYGYHG